MYGSMADKQLPSNFGGPSASPPGRPESRAGLSTVSRRSAAPRVPFVAVFPQSPGGAYFQILCKSPNHLPGPTVNFI
jgi:hypothetical protein